jgi:AcrR family transcriptional regulator
MAGTVVALKARRTQAERTAATRARLLDATIECLFERGWAGTTTTEVANRAGVSRGAQLHHFPTKSELVATAVEHLFARRHDEFVRAIATLPEGLERAAAAVDLLWSMVSGPTFYAWLELVVAARTDPTLRETVAAIGRRFTETIERTFPELFPRPAEPNPFYETTPMFVFALMDGLALQHISDPSDQRAARIIEALKQLAQLIIPAR